MIIHDSWADIAPTIQAKKRSRNFDRPAHEDDADWVAPQTPAQVPVDDGPSKPHGLSFTLKARNARKARAKAQAKTPKFVEFIVEGDGVFPIDMLRYDVCLPASEADSNEMNLDRKLRAVTLRGPRKPTTARWESFGWKVIGIVKEH